MSLTPRQTAAVKARGNVLVVAGAGTGKTKTLVERCIDCLRPDGDRAFISEMLIVTFTEAAAAEMRQRIRMRLEDLAAGDPQGSWWQEQLALFETAQIGTLHSFCLRLLRQHFYALSLDPQIAVMSEEESHLLGLETLEAMLHDQYAQKDPDARALIELMAVHGRQGDKLVRELILHLHAYTQTLPDPEGWYQEQLKAFAGEQPERWREWLAGFLPGWRQHWLSVLGRMGDNVVVTGCREGLSQLIDLANVGDAETRRSPPRERQGADLAGLAAALDRVKKACDNCPKGKKTAFLKPLRDFLDDVEFLASLVKPANGTDALKQDWDWVRPQMVAVIKAARDFTRAFTSAKQEAGTVDFHDLEQYALKLLWDSEGTPSRTAEEWRRQLRFIFVDEYQDINTAQDRILQALARDGSAANRFLVGDVKQSIYRFRLANPGIFQRYVREWGGHGNAIALVDNFRTRENLLRCINALFQQIMRTEVGEVAYDDQARLVFGDPANRHQLSCAEQPDPCVELHWLIQRKNAEALPDESAAEIAELRQAEKEARLAVLRLRRLRAEGFQVYTGDGFRPVEWRDMVVLLRSPAKKAESYAKEFSRAGIPLLLSRAGFYRTSEIADLVSVLQILDNPLQDLPLIAVLRSPLCGLSLDELAAIRLATKGRFWTALQRWHQLGSKAPQPESESAGMAKKVGLFLDRFGKWRRLVRLSSVSGCLEAILNETGYEQWLLTQPRGQQRALNVQRLLAQAHRFDEFQRQGLFRFLRFIEAQQDAGAEPEVAEPIAEDAVRLMSIHQSKGLEFPVVVLSDLSKPFNQSDLRASIILDERFGVCPKVRPPGTGASYPSLPHWLARQRQHRELLGEELRLLYVAMTRARDRLILTSTIKPGQVEALGENTPTSEESLLAARSYADWLRPWFSQLANGASTERGQVDFLCWDTHEDEDLLEGVNLTVEGEQSLTKGLDPAAIQTLHTRFSQVYPFQGLTRQPAKASVSALRKRAADPEEVAAAYYRRFQRDPARTEPSTGTLSAVDVGTAHHLFLQHLDLSTPVTLKGLQAERDRMAAKGVLTAEQGAALDFTKLSSLWKSDLGQKIRCSNGFVRRELAFTARFSLKELAGILGESQVEPVDEFIVVQGAIDLALITPQDIVIVDFKTDHIPARELDQRVKAYKPQLELYTRALENIYRRPVSETWLYFLALEKAVRLERFAKP